MVAVAFTTQPGVAYAAKYKLDLVAGGEQKSRMNSGVEVVDSDLQSSSIRVFGNEEPVKKRGALQIYVLNAGSEGLNFGSENVTVETETGTQIAVIPYEKLVKEEKNRQMWAAIGAGLNAASNSMNAAFAGNSYGTVNAYGSGGWARANYSAYNPAAASIATNVANMQNQQMFDRLAATNSIEINALKMNLRTTTINPGKDFGGQVTYELPKPLRSSKEPIPIRIRIRIGDEEHIVRANLVPVK